MDSHSSTTSDDTVDQSSRTLVVLLHGFSKKPASLNDLVNLLRQQPQFQNATFFTPQLPLGFFSLEDPMSIANNIVEGIDKQWEALNGEIDRIILIGHSYGALLARMVYVIACGETQKHPFDQAITDHVGRPWAEWVERLVLLAGLNRGWQISHHLAPHKAVLWTLGVMIGSLLWPIKRRMLTIFGIHKGAPFITQLRIQWLWMRRYAEQRGLGNALTVQLLGSIDDMVAPEDNIDLVSGRDFVYLDVPHSGHADVINVADAELLPVPTTTGAKSLGEARFEQICKALVTPAEVLQSESVLPGDDAPAQIDTSVQDVVFVIHGIRDRGYWTHKIARRVQALAMQRGDEEIRIATATASYGYFPMLPFLLPHKRHEKVEWLMDQYTEALARWPNARFSFVGHSNGTYLLARALQDYPWCKFQNVVFAGSVVPTRYPWAKAIQRGQVKHVLNYVATADWVVAIFPKAMEMIQWQDLGSAGHDGFSESSLPGVTEIRYIRGAHSAALVEENWDTLAHFILDGTPAVPIDALQASFQSDWTRLAGNFAPFIWIILFAILLITGMYIWHLDLGQIQISILATFAFAVVIWKVITRI